METAPKTTSDESRLEAIAGKITAGIYAAPLAQATARQRELALSVAGNIVAMLDADTPKREVDTA